MYKQLTKLTMSRLPIYNKYPISESGQLRMTKQRLN